MKVRCPVDDVRWESVYGSTTCWFCDGFLGVPETPQVIGTWPFDMRWLLYQPKPAMQVMGPLGGWVAAAKAAASILAP